MGRQTNPKIRGTFNGIIYYEWRGGWYVRSVPGRVKQTPATKTAGLQFGRANSLGRHLRNMLAAAIPNAKDKDMQRRFVTALYRWLQSGSLFPLQGFDFSSPYFSVPRLHFPVTVSSAGGMLHLQVPELTPATNIPAPRGTATVICTIAVATIEKGNCIAVNNTVASFTIPYHAMPLPPQEILLGCVQTGCLTLVGLLLEYIVEGKQVEELRWMPSGVIGAFYQ